MSTYRNMEVGQIMENPPVILSPRFWGTCGIWSSESGLRYRFSGAASNWRNSLDKESDAVADIAAERSDELFKLLGRFQIEGRERKAFVPATHNHPRRRPNTLAEWCSRAAQPHRALVPVALLCAFLLSCRE